MFSHEVSFGSPGDNECCVASGHYFRSSSIFPSYIVLSFKHIDSPQLFKFLRYRSLILLATDSHTLSFFMGDANLLLDFVMVPSFVILFKFLVKIAEIDSLCSRAYNHLYLSQKSLILLFIVHEFLQFYILFFKILDK
jgi:hypothetical protein